MKKCAWVVYDGIDNSVFYSQVFVPIMRRLQADPELHVTLITFESKPPRKETVAMLKNSERLSLTMLRRWPFVGQWSLRPAQASLMIELAGDEWHEVWARGPFAGWLVCAAGDALVTSKLWIAGNEPTVTIQARGLAAEEYRMTMAYTPWISWQKLVWRLRYQHIKNLEHSTYQKGRGTIRPHIESVTVALQNYLITKFDAAEHMFSIAEFDKPETVEVKKRLMWRSMIRMKLNIPDEAKVYCYSGSAKAWQGVERTLRYFEQCAKTELGSYFLILSGEPEIFRAKVVQFNLSPARLIIMNVKPAELMQYLCAADVGVLLRDFDPVNWVSRPTKVLEYLAAGLTVVHNGTVKWIDEVLNAQSGEIDVVSKQIQRGRYENY